MYTGLTFVRQGITVQVMAMLQLKLWHTFACRLGDDVEKHGRRVEGCLPKL